MAVILLVFVTIWVWTHLSAGVYTSTTSPVGPTSVDKNLMMLEAGSGSHFDSIWGQQSYNDAGGTKSDMEPADVLSGGEFKVAIDPAWGNPDWVWLTFLSANGAVIGEIRFHTPNTNISGHTSWMPATFAIIYPLNITEANFTVSEGNTDVIVRQPSTTNMWIAALHKTSGPEFVLATTVAGSFRTGSSPTVFNAQNTTLLSVNQTGPLKNLTVNLQNEPDWPGEYMYVNGITVLGMDRVNVTYNIEYMDYIGTFIMYETDLNGTLWEGQTGMAYDLETILIKQLSVLFSGTATGVTIYLIGPSGNGTHPGYVTARYLLVSGLFTTPTSTTTSSFVTTPSPASSSPPTITSSTTVTPSTSITPTVSSTVSTTATPASSTVSTTTTPASSTVSTIAISTTTPAVSSYSIVINGKVYCPCTVTTQNVTNVTTTDIEAIIAELTLDKSKLSSNRRRYNSADDSRPSAKTLGALGVIVISIVVGVVVIMDFANLKAEAGKIKKNYRYLKKQLSRKSLKINDLATISNNQDSRSQSLPEVCM